MLTVRERSLLTLATGNSILLNVLLWFFHHYHYYYYHHHRRRRRRRRHRHRQHPFITHKPAHIIKANTYNYYKGKMNLIKLSLPCFTFFLYRSVQQLVGNAYKCHFWPLVFEKAMNIKLSIDFYRTTLYQYTLCLRKSDTLEDFSITCVNFHQIINFTSTPNVHVKFHEKYVGLLALRSNQTLT